MNSKYLCALVLILVSANFVHAKIPKPKPSKNPLLSTAVQKLRNMDPSILNNHLQQSQATYQKLKTSYQWFQKLREAIKRKQETLTSNGISASPNLDNLKNDIFTCTPTQENAVCYSKCEKATYSYRWCYTSSEFRSSQFSECDCHLKPEILQFLKLSKAELLTPKEKSPSTLELTFIILTPFLILTIIVFAIIIGINYWRQQADGLPVNGNLFVQNPIFNPEN